MNVRYVLRAIRIPVGRDVYTRDLTARSADAGCLLTDPWPQSTERDVALLAAAGAPLIQTVALWDAVSLPPVPEIESAKEPPYSVAARLHMRTIARGRWRLNDETYPKPSTIVWLADNARLSRRLP